MNWKVWYIDGSTFSDEPGTDERNASGAWLEAPTEGVAIVSVRDQETDQLYGRWWLHRADYYHHHELLGGKYPLPSNDLLATLLSWGIEPPDPFPRPELFREMLKELGVLGRVKFGATTTEENWSALVRRAHLDPDLPPGDSPMRRASDTEGVRISG